MVVTDDFIRTGTQLILMKINPYLFFDGDAEEAFRFYERIFDGELQGLQHFEDVPEGADELTDEQKDLVLHVGLELSEDQTIMGSDVLEGMGDGHIEGNNVAISVAARSRENADEIFEAFAEGGMITMPMEEQFWGDYFGSVTDRFGINWMVSAPIGNQ